jgi:hypothetical protein
VCKLEQKLTANQGRATTEFVKDLGRRYSRLVSGNYIVAPTPIPPPAPPLQPRGALSGFSLALDQEQLRSPGVRGLLSEAMREPHLGLRNRLAEFDVARPGNGLMSTASREPMNSLAAFLHSTPASYPTSPVATPPAPPAPTVVDYTICWGPLGAFIEGKLSL